VKWLTANSNACTRAKVVDNKFYGKKWDNICMEEMLWTSGMIMKMSLINIQYGGIWEYFIPTKKIYPSCLKPVVVKGANSEE
jgi:hypothetical protein